MRYGANRGYIGWSESVRSRTAKEFGIYPKTQFKKEYHISEKVFQEILNAGGFDTEWHHTSKFFNRTDFYKWNETGIGIIARKDFEKHLDTIISFCENANEYGVYFDWWYDELWQESEPCMPLIDVVCYYMLEEQERDALRDERKRLAYVNAEWTMRWAMNNPHATAIVDKVQQEIDSLTFSLFPGDENSIYDFINHARNHEILTDESWREYVKERYAKTYGAYGSIDINEFVRRSKVAKVCRSLVRRYKPVEKIHRHATMFDVQKLKHKYMGEELEYALSLYNYYNQDETLHV